MKIYIIIGLLSITHLLSAQVITTQNLVWQASSAVDVNTGDILSTEGDKVVSHGSTSVEWKDSQGNVRYTYTVNTVNGTWNNVSNNGSIIYQVTTGSKSGTITFIRSGSEISVRILVLNDGDDIPDMYEIKIASITTL